MKKEVLSPGKVLNDLIQEHGISRQQLVKDLKDVSLSTVCQILNGNTRISTVVGLKLSKYFKQADDYWINLQQKYDIAEAVRDPEVIASLKNIKPLKISSKSAKGPAENPPKRGRKPKEAPPAEKKAGRRSKVEKADKPVNESKPSRTKALKDDNPEKPARASRKASPVKEEEPVEAKATRTRRPRAPKAEDPFINEASMESPPKVVKPRKPRTKKDTTAPEAPDKKELQVILIKNGDTDEDAIAPTVEDIQFVHPEVYENENTQTDQSNDFESENGEDYEGSQDDGDKSKGQDGGQFDFE